MQEANLCQAKICFFSATLASRTHRKTLLGASASAVSTFAPSKPPLLKGLGKRNKDK